VLARVPLVIATLGASYYVYSETIRRTITHRRRQAALARRARKVAAAAVGTQLNRDPEEELEMAREQFSSTVIGGRYANCTEEWREQGKPNLGGGGAALGGELAAEGLTTLVLLGSVQVRGNGCSGR